MIKTEITGEPLAQVKDKVNFVIKRLYEMQVFCEHTRDVEPSTYAEQSHFMLGLCGLMLDEVGEMLGDGRQGMFDGHHDMKTIGIAN